MGLDISINVAPSNNFIGWENYLSCLCSGRYVRIHSILVRYMKDNAATYYENDEAIGYEAGGGIYYIITYTVWKNFMRKLSEEKDEIHYLTGYVLSDFTDQYPGIMGYVPYEYRDLSDINLNRVKKFDIWQSQTIHYPRLIRESNDGSIDQKEIENVIVQAYYFQYWMNFDFTMRKALSHGKCVAIISFG